MVQIVDDGERKGGRERESIRKGGRDGRRREGMMGRK